jgi:hypothetical protein
MARVGTLTWANETGGQLTPWDRLVLLFGQGVQMQVELVGRSVFRSAGLIQPSSPGQLEAVPYVRERIPRTRIAEAAEALCKETSDTWLLAHCYRTFAFGALLGRNLSFDWETLFVASMLHDIGLTPAFGRGVTNDLVSGYARTNAPCFAVRGAGVAETLATIHGWPAACRDTLAEAISIHANVYVRRSQGIEAHLLNVGSALDVAGLRLDRLPHQSVRSVDDEWQRGDRFCRELWNVWAREAKEHPECRGRFLNVWGSFRRRLYRSCPRRWG